MKIALLGLTFKPNTDDMRDLRAIAVAQALSAAEVELAAYDPLSKRLNGSNALQ